MFAQRLSRLPCMYSNLSLLRLWNKRCYQQWIGALSEQLNTLAPHAHLRRCFANAYKNIYRHRYTKSVTQYEFQEDIRTTYPEIVKENEYARNLFLNSVKYANSMSPLSVIYAHVTNKEALQLLNKDWNLKNNEAVLSALKKLSYNIRYSKESIDPLMYESFINVLCTRCQSLTDNDLTVMMTHLVPIKKQLESNTFYQTLCKMIDKECLERFSNVSRDNMLSLCDLFHQLAYNKNSDFMSNIMKKLGKKPNRLSPQQLVQVLYFLNICRKPPINMYELEYRLEQCIDELSVNELGVATLGFFKTGTKIQSSDLLNRIIKKTITEIEMVDSASIGAIFKLIRYSMQLTEIPVLKLLLSSIHPHVPRFTLMSLTHIAHACARVMLYDEELIDKIIDRLNKELKTVRLKNIERLIFVFATFNIDSSNSVYHNVVEELRATWNTTRASEIAQFPYVASRILGFLSTVNIYPMDLITYVMTPEFIHKTCNGNHWALTREYCVLDFGLRIEVPEYCGPFLQPNVLTFLSKKHFLLNTPENKTRTNMMFSSVLQTCQEIFHNTSEILACRPLPHYVTSDIIFCLDEHNQLVPSKDVLSEFGEEKIKRIDEENSKNVRWIALVIAPYVLTIRSTHTPTGPLGARIRQLSTIGYTPIVILQNKWDDCKTPDEKRDYIRSLIF